MIVYLSQHGRALSREDNNKRPLSAVGVKECESVAKFLKNKGYIFNKIFHSGKLRSEESAKIFSRILSNGEIIERRDMRPDDSVESFCSNLCEDSLYIGHLPQFSSILSKLVLDSKVSDVLNFRNSGVLCLEQIHGIFRIKWYITPDLV